MELNHANTVLTLQLEQDEKDLASIFKAVYGQMTDDPTLERLVIDLGKVHIISSMHIGLLVKVTKQLEAHGRTVIIVNISETEQETFTLSSLDQVLTLDCCGATQEQTGEAINLGLGIDYEIHGGVSTFIFSGIMNSPADTRLFRTIYRKALHDSPRLLLDFSGITYIDSEGVSELLTLHRESEKLGCSVRICGASEILLELLEVCSLGAFIPIFDSAEGALAGWGGPAR